MLAGPGISPARSARQVNGVLTAVRGMVVHAVAAGQAPGHLVPLLYEVADDRDLPGQARGDDGRMSWRLRARHRLREPETRVDRASDEEIVALLRACLLARDRLIVLLMARAGLRCGEPCGLRRSDVHLLADSGSYGTRHSGHHGSDRRRVAFSMRRAKTADSARSRRARLPRLGRMLSNRYRSGAHSRSPRRHTPNSARNFPRKRPGQNPVFSSGPGTRP